ncbi:MAG: 50S ribosomal protein L40e [Candidatus Methanofastidiosum methylothiophilum]|jgi:ribosomal protein L40E|uniref:50S ribosomal protein L40e n=1 Tax=Candidatus Methanofastidiosum methylothiophilum TaxID=1705564 RepID=A0A150IVD0_9EURY|nr:MAG: 50S ribosomal protein L40e [Candidatus Methanofastidiosum methylthiophilus]OPX57172.1 MAG: 50S ribosomal protein L40e [Methanobacterium sp. PtaB.Bin024]
MGYLVCDKCGGYYELQEGESPDDFGVCECGGELKYTKTISQPNENLNQQKCPNCGFINIKTAHFCRKCGFGLGTHSGKQICSRCGTENPFESRFCHKCGENLKSKNIDKIAVKKPKNRDIGTIWYVVGFIIPLIGIIAGLIFATQRRKNAGILILVSLIIPILAVLAFLFMFYQAYFVSPNF